MRFQNTWVIVLSLLVGISAVADSNIDATDKYAYSANTGWINAQGDITNGLVVGTYYCAGYLYGANIGWINAGDGTPTNGYSYGNDSAADFGVNHDGVGNLRGYAYGANVGWINFEANGAAKVDLMTGNLSGYAYGANIGWISLSNAQAFVKTTSLDPGPDTDLDGIPDPWEYDQVGNLTDLSSTNDFDGDEVLDGDEYGADTNPDGIASFLHITSIDLPAPNTNEVVWPVEPTRLYDLEVSTDGSLTNWADSGLGTMSPGSLGSMTQEVTQASQTSRFYRVKAQVPLAP